MADHNNNNYPNLPVPSPYQQPTVMYGNQVQPMIYTQPQQQVYVSPSSPAVPTQPVYYFPSSPPPPGTTTTVVYSNGTTTMSSNATQPLLGGAVPQQQYHNVKERLCARVYDTHTGRWFDEAWHFFGEHWLHFVLFTLLLLLIDAIPYVGPILALPLTPGYFMCGAHFLRTGGAHFNGRKMFDGFYYTFPLLVLTILYTIIVTLGLFLLIIPGIYFAVVLSMSIPLYLEYHHEGLSMLDSMSVSMKVLRKQFWNILGFLLVQFLLIFVGLLVFVIPALVTIPLAMLMSVYAFRDIFGIAEHKPHDHSCVVC